MSFTSQIRGWFLTAFPTLSFPQSPMQDIKVPLLSLWCCNPVFFFSSSFPLWIFLILFSLILNVLVRLFSLAMLIAQSLAFVSPTILTQRLKHLIQYIIRKC
jgi:hypothetical protein